MIVKSSLNKGLENFSKDCYDSSFSHRQLHIGSQQIKQEGLTRKGAPFPLQESAFF